MLWLGTMSSYISWTCCYEASVTGTPQSRSYVVILVFRPYLLRSRAVALSRQGCRCGSLLAGAGRWRKRAGRQTGPFRTAMKLFVLMGLTC